MVRRPLLAGLMLLAIAGCKKEAPKPPDAETGGTPQIASLDDLDLPVDKSDQITAIDAATGDASGMPRDGGAVVAPPKPQAHQTVQAPDAASNAAALPLVTPPPPPQPPSSPPPAPAVTIPVGN